jgi:hypothetical protein
VEIDFLAYMRLKQAYATTRDDKANVTVTAEAADEFIRDHFTTLGRALAQNLEASGIRYLALAAQALVQRLGPTTAPLAHSTQEAEPAPISTLPIYEPDEGCEEFFD